MTTDATGLRIAQPGMRTFNRFHDLLVAFSASLLSHNSPALGDVNVVIKPTCGEVIRMPETVLRFGRIFCDEAGWRMAVVADSNSAMA
jgi:hypothetical protein